MQVALNKAAEASSSDIGCFPHPLLYIIQAFLQMP
jgi:hypothetical protein